MKYPGVYADFQNADSRGRVRLNCAGTLQDLTQQKIQLREGMSLLLHSDDADESGAPDDLQVTGIVEYSPEENGWVASIKWEEIQHSSETGNDTKRSGPARHAG